MIEINYSNLFKYRDEIESNLKQFNIISFDTEFSGVSFPHHLPSLFDDSYNRYLKLKVTCTNYSLLQIGFYMTNFTTEIKYNIYVKPISCDGFDEIYSFQPSTMQFLEENYFNFNKIDKGIPYVSKKLSPLFKFTLEQMDNIAFCKQVLYLNSNTRNIINDKKSQSDDTLSIFEKDTKMLYEALTNPLNNKNDFIKYEKEAVRLKKQFYDVVTWLPNLIELLFFGSIDKNCASHAVGEQIGKILIGHNCLIDLMFLYQKFIGPLPSTLTEFSRILFSLKSNNNSQHYLEPLFNVLKISIPDTILNVNDHIFQHHLKEDEACSSTTFKDTAVAQSTYQHRQRYLFDTKYMLKKIESLFNLQKILCQKSNKDHQYITNNTNNYGWKKFEYQNLEYAYINLVVMMKPQKKVALNILTNGSSNMVMTGYDDDGMSSNSYHQEETAHTAMSHQAAYDSMMCFKVFVELICIVMRNNPYDYNGDGLIAKFELHEAHPIENTLKDLIFTFYNRLAREPRFDMKISLSFPYNYNYNNNNNLLRDEKRPNIFVLTPVNRRFSSHHQSPDLKSRSKVILENPIAVCEINFQFKNLLQFYFQGKNNKTPLHHQENNSPDIFEHSEGQGMHDNDVWKELKLLLDIVGDCNKNTCTAIDWIGIDSGDGGGGGDRLTNPLTNYLHQPDLLEKISWKHLFIACPNHYTATKLVKSFLNKGIIPCPNLKIPESSQTDLSTPSKNWSVTGGGTVTTPNFFRKLSFDTIEACDDDSISTRSSFSQGGGEHLNNSSRQRRVNKYETTSPKKLLLSKTKYILIKLPQNAHLSNSKIVF